MQTSDMQASFSTLLMSIGSAAMMSLGLAPNPASGKIEKNIELAKFNIDLLDILRAKSKGNLDADEERLLTQLIADLQLKYVDAQ
ncbi:MAG: DUF1844 domain-containing protein [Bdellovibrionales bacterium]